MFVYGIPCNIDDLAYMPSTLTADYYADSQLLIFPSYTKPVCLNAHGNPSSEFWIAAKRIIAEPHKTHSVTLEHPYLTDDEGDAIVMLQELHPRREPGWYYMPIVISRADVPPTQEFSIAELQAALAQIQSTPV